MSRKALIILGAILVVGLAWIVWLDDPEDEGPDETPRLLDFEMAAVVAFELSDTDGAIAIQREGPGSWHLAGATPREADPREVEALLSALSSARIDETVLDPADDLASFGLDPPRHTLRLSLEGQKPSRVVMLGDAAPIVFARYARVDDGAVLLVSANLHTALDRQARDFVERRFAPVDPALAVAVTCSGGPEAYTLTRVGEAWRLMNPVHDRADDSSAISLVRALTSLEANRFPSSESIADLDDAFERAILFTLVVGEGKKQWVIEIGGSAGPNESWVRRGSGAFYGAVSHEALADLLRPFDELRERDLVFLSRPEVSELRFRAGDQTWSLRRQPGARSWIVVEDGSDLPREIPPQRVEEVLDRFRWLESDAFLDGSGPVVDPDREIIAFGENGELGRISARSEVGHEGLIRVESSWRPGFVFGLSPSRWAELPVSAVDLAAPVATDSP